MKKSIWEIWLEKELGLYPPVPSIDDNLSPLKNYSIDSASNFILFNSKPGEFVKDTKYLKKDIDFLDGWKDGFSSGAIITPQKEQVIYWLIVW